MSFFETNSSSNSTETCENCSSNFTIFKRKKTCHICRQQFCQSCVNRHQITLSTGGSGTSSSERICIICQSICLPQTTTDDLMKYKLKHLRSILNAANVATNTCKEKRDLAELVLRNKTRINFSQTSDNQNANNNTRQSSQSSQSSTSNNNSQQQTHSQPSSAASNPSNNTFSNFMNNVQDFVNFNINSVSQFGNMPAQPMPGPAGGQNANTRNTNSRSSSSSSGASQTRPNDANNSTNNNNNNGNKNTFTHSSFSSSAIPNTNPSGSSTNLNGLFNLISEQVPNVLNQTFTNNQFTFNNLFTNDNPPPGSTSTQTNGDTNNDSQNNNNYNNQSQTPTNSQASGGSANSTTNASNEPPTSSTTSDLSASASNTRRRASLSDLTNEEEIDKLTIKQIKEILACNFVDYKGCCEKKELVDKTKRLFASHLENKRLENEINQSSSGSSSNSSSSGQTKSGTGQPVTQQATCGHESDVEKDGGEPKMKKIDEDDLCKICMESLINCVLLDCGHMVSCIKCGKRLAECPMCRQNIVRVIRVFKS